MKINRFLIVGHKKGHKPSARLTVTTPGLEWHEVAVKVTLDIPDELFTKPQLEASIIVPKDALAAPVIEAETTDNIQKIISKELGVDLQISVVEPANTD